MDSPGKTKVKKKKMNLKPIKNGFRVFIYLLIALIFIRGIVGIVKNERAEAYKLYAKTENLLYQGKPYYEKDDIRSFAKGFAKAYLTVSPKDPTFEDRLEPYVASYLGNMKVNVYRVDKTMKVEDVFVWEVEKSTEDQVSITVRADIHLVWQESLELDDGTKEILEKEEKTTRFLKIPIQHLADGSYVVDDYPMFVPAPDKGHISYTSLNRSGTSQSVKKALTELSNNFYKTYFSGNPTEISYYLENGEKIMGFENELLFKGIDEINTYLLDPETGRCLVTGKLMIEDPVTGILHYQSMHFEAQEKDDRWYILNFDGRSMNLTDYMIKNEEE